MPTTGRGPGPRVSVGMPVFNGEPYIAAAIECILGQDYEDLELIVADNASTDGTEDIARSYATHDPRVRYVRHERNLGAARNFNMVVELARGELFRWASHDDVSAPGYIARCVEVLDQDPTVLLAYTRAAMIDGAGEVTHHYPSYAYAFETSPGNRARSVLRRETPCLECFGLTRRSALLRTSMIGPYTASDRALFLEWALRGRFHEVDEVLFFHRQHATRSVHRYRDDRARNAWFDPARATARTSPRWRLLYQYTRSIAQAPVPVRERLLAAAGLPGWANRNRRALAGEAAVRAGFRPVRSRATAAEAESMGG